MRLQLNFEIIVSVCAIITSVVALFIAVKQTELMQNQQDASVWPIVTSDITISQDDDESFIEFKLANVGVGPAFVRDGDLYIDGSVINDYSVIEELLLVGSLKDGVSMDSSELFGVLGAGDKKTVLRLAWRRNESNDMAFRLMVKHFLERPITLGMYQCYCSVFNRCYQSGRGYQQGPVEVSACSTADVDPIAFIRGSAQKNTRMETPQNDK